MSTTATLAGFQLHPASRLWLWAEFVTFYLVAPVAIAVFLPATWMFPALFLVTGIGLVLLHVTKGFDWHDLRHGLDAVRPRDMLLFAVLMLGLCLAVIMATAPGQAFALLKQNPGMLLVIALFYPIVSALPQEVIFRPLFFRRYGRILPGGKKAIVLNAAVFSLAHLMYWSGIVAVMTFVGGLLFAWAYEIRRSFLLALALHSVAGVVLFAVGLGIYFYSGNVVRPF
ncbi:CPBP family intramembrane glutamic endopeptidase [Shimia biformata]|uniref:CPBP family intramembrane glutamic endopeptidase n=1 Tax=Shimia biformata TaxID=1294299 RepID=UPI00194ED377|nr:CPBP family intramembrane glutamic endopeptidase [Shimia biformata]